MTFFYDIFATIRDFFEAGGPVLWGIFVTTAIMWSLIMERLWYFRIVMPERMEELKSQWTKRKDHTSWYARRIRQRMLSEFSYEAHAGTHIVKVCVAVAPLFGLLGTVWGMIEAFSNIALQDGLGKPELLASGISQALITTAAGLTVAIPSLMFYRYFRGRVDELVVTMEQEALKMVEALHTERATSTGG